MTIINMNGGTGGKPAEPVLQEVTVTPPTLPYAVGPDEGYDGLSQVTVNPDSQLVPANIRSGKTVFGVEGSFVGEPQPVERLPVDFTVDGWNINRKGANAFLDLGNTANTQYETKIGSYQLNSKAGYQYKLSQNGVVTDFRAWSSRSMGFLSGPFYPSEFYCDKVTIAEPIVIDPGEYSITCPINLFSSVGFSGTIAVFPVLRGNGSMTVPTTDYEVIENVVGRTNGSFTITTTETFTIPAKDYLVDRGAYFESTKIAFSFVPIEIDQVTS